jgi:cytochrome b subunit of formate dehydrogenase
MATNWGRRAEDKEYFARLSRVEVWQHNIVWICFVLLVATGMMSLLPTDWVTALFGGYTGQVYHYRHIVHLILAATLIAGSLWHLAYGAVTKRGRQMLLDMIPKPVDAIQMKQNIMYMLGMSDFKPKFDRFDYREKMEYIFGLIGTTVICVTGVVMTFAQFFPRFMVDLCGTVHLCEATLASITISIWHFYAIHWKPGKFPQDTSWLDGLVSMEHLKHEHPLQWERVMKEREMAKEGMKGASSPSASGGGQHGHYNNTLGTEEE